MASVFTKLQLKDQAEILVLHAPPSFEPELAALTETRVVHDAADVERIGFALVFVTTQEQVDATAPVLAAQAPGDAMLWYAYPKGTSKIESSINRDRGWDALEAAGFAPVRQVAIDADWSALRFRRVEYIKRSART